MDHKLRQSHRAPATLPRKLAFTAAEAVQASTLSRPTIYRLIKRNELRMTKVGGRRLIPYEALAALILTLPKTHTPK